MEQNRGRRNHRRSRDATNPVINSTCNGVRVRGTLAQVVEKFKQLAREATNEIDAEGFRQQMEHYQRMRNKLVAEREIGSKDF